MIKVKCLKYTHLCSEDYSKIEGYENAVNSNKRYVIHHRDEIRKLPSGMISYRSLSELKEDGRYYFCPASELIFMPLDEHVRLHQKFRHPCAKNTTWTSDRNPNKGKPAHNKGIPVNKDMRRRLSEIHTGMKYKEMSVEGRNNISNAHKGLKLEFVNGKRLFYRIINNTKVYCSKIQS